ncbi:MULTISPECIES: pilus assembly FimT family protein [unclassified Coleofasciculus]|uniref:pilus assembly FimT family protein n=1 Tax=unclassified Coleofasciculus TaxID=2692782 RepID=UPI001881721A|nr:MULTISPECIES: type II secretion system protein [unclassified Coleofasciculus]MBE9126700.1 type II secretion system protein [Coleofasciculus sp. LEGE 07081]MBE9150060.1 type II secretion system protein [Coleofasciculus sp. LEGE 07092]
MGNPALLKIRRRFHNYTAAKVNQRLSKQSSPKGDAGFTLIELIVVVLIIAVLSAIAAPGWLAFVNRQRVAKVNDAVYSAIQEAQREAKRTKRDYTVSFKTDGDKSLKSAVYLDGTLPANIPWQPLSQTLDIQPGQVILCSNIDTTANKVAGSTTCNFTDPRSIRFNFQGSLAGDPKPELGDTNDRMLSVTVGIPQSDNATQPIPATARCVMVKTLIGSMQLGQDKYDPTSDSQAQGCPL